VDNATLAVCKKDIIDVILIADSNLVSDTKIVEAIVSIIRRSNPDIHVKGCSTRPSIANEHIDEYIFGLSTNQRGKSPSCSTFDRNKAVLRYKIVKHLKYVALECRHSDNVLAETTCRSSHVQFRALLSADSSRSPTRPRFHRVDCCSLLQLSDHSLLWSTALNLTKPQATGRWQQAANTKAAAGCRSPNGLDGSAVKQKLFSFLIPGFTVQRNRGIDLPHFCQTFPQQRTATDDIDWH
jgi:hypothetical protein